MPAGLAAGCGGPGRDAASPAAPPPHAVAARRSAVAHKPARLVVTVVDGDQRLRVPGAVVRLWGRSARTDRHGVAEIRVPWRRGLHVTVRAARLRDANRVRARSTGSGRVTVRIYRPELQWPLYGATDSRAQAQAHIRLRPPFRIVWAVPLGGLIEFPAVVDDGVAYIGNAQATVRAISMRTGNVLWRHDTPHAEMASSPAVAGRDVVYHSMDGHVFVLDRATGKLRWSYRIGSPIESSPIVHDGVDYFGAWNGRVYALDLRTAAAALDAGARREDHLERLDRRRHALHRRLRRPPVGALRRARARHAGSRSVNGRIYGTPAVAARARVRPVLDRRLADRVLDRRRLPLAHPDRRVRLLVARGVGRPGLLRLVQRRLLRRLGGERPRSSGRSAPAARSPAPPSSSTASPTPAASRTGSSASTRAPAVCSSGSSTAQYVAVSGNGMQLLFHGYSTLYAVQPQRAVRQPAAG